MAGGQGCCEVCTSCLILKVLLAVLLLILAYGVVDNVGVTVEDASLSRLDLAGANGTDLAYSISLTVAVYNPNWAVRAEYTQPLAAELQKQSTVIVITTGRTTSSSSLATFALLSTDLFATIV